MEGGHVLVCRAPFARGSHEALHLQSHLASIVDVDEQAIDEHASQGCLRSGVSQPQTIDDAVAAPRASSADGTYASLPVSLPQCHGAKRSMTSSHWLPSAL